ncbi:ATP-binding protein [Streptomyces sp. A0592]|uniref:ATP-binding protein n=1 Tax=Streptomyces sp. A0592 TaxID=2563099 RepID=UPI00109E7F82|nr:ATP-binding protein [Streptomyces sp. A0592]THA87011.1 ATP-binding protein [Streptomyces sp. A0592]
MDTALATAPHTRPSTVHHPLPSGPQAAREARRITAWLLAVHPAACPHDTTEDILVIVSELTSNAIRHARPPYALTLSVEPGRAGIALSDASPALPRQHDARGPLATRGRGLEIIRALGAELFVSPAPLGKQVIAVVTWPEN